MLFLVKFLLSTLKKKILHGEYRFATNLDQYEQAVKHNLYTAQKVILENGLTVINYHGYWLKDPLGDETSVYACAPSPT